MTPHKCTACSCEYTDDEGGIQGDFGMLPMSFCPTCLSCICDMAEQLIAKEWVGLTYEDRQELAATQHDWESLCNAVEAKLKELNS